MVLQNLSSSYSSLEEYDKALLYANESKFYNFLMGADQRMVQNLRFIAEIYQKINQPKKAKEALQEALEFVKIHDSNPKKEFQQMLENKIRNMKVD